MIAMKEVYLTPEQVGERLQISYDTVVRLCRRNKLPAVKVAGQWRIPESKLEQFLEENRNNPQTKK